MSYYNESFPDLPTAVKGSVPGLVATSQRRLVACKLRAFVLHQICSHYFRWIYKGPVNLNIHDQDSRGRSPLILRIRSDVDCVSFSCSSLEPVGKLT